MTSEWLDAKKAPSSGLSAALSNRQEVFLAAVNSFASVFALIPSKRLRRIVRRVAAA